MRVNITYDYRLNYTVVTYLHLDHLSFTSGVSAI